VPSSPLAAEQIGAGPSRLLLVHGFTQTCRSWRLLLPRLADAHEVISVDAPGHGRSHHDEADLPTGATLLAEVGGRATYIGYSMGGRLALHVAVGHPQFVERLVLIGATAGIEDDDERARRRRSDGVLAAHLERVGVDAFLDEWIAQPLFAGLDPVAADLDDRRRNRVDGLAASLRHAGTGAQEPLWHRLGGITCPVLMMVGEHDDKFREIAERMAALLPDASVAVVAGAGHSVHLEQPERAADIVLTWLDDQPPRARPTVAATP
jgi:2-succinyl-6-hydroxy-2,4-cyclohexadiene-1-carboxylate synthase